MADEEKKIELNPKQELFCQLYATDREFFGNGVQSYIEAYNPDKTKKNWYQIVCIDASKLLSNSKVCARINELLSNEGLNDSFVDKQLLYLITQHEDKNAKNQAIREYNKLKQRIIDRMDLTSKGEKIIPILGGITNDIPKNDSDKQTSKTD